MQSLQRMLHIPKIVHRWCTHTAQMMVQSALAKMDALNHQLVSCSRPNPTGFLGLQLDVASRRKNTLVNKGGITKGGPKPWKGSVFLTDYLHD